MNFSIMCYDATLTKDALVITPFKGEPTITFPIVDGKLCTRNLSQYFGTLENSGVYHFSPKKDGKERSDPPSHLAAAYQKEHRAQIKLSLYLDYVKTDNAGVDTQYYTFNLSYQGRN